MMHKTATDFAISRQMSLGRYVDGPRAGYYYLRCDNGERIEMSLYPTARSAIAMMRKELRHAFRRVGI